MSMFHKIQVGDKVITPIDWEMTPDLTFGTYESWGGRERVRNNDEMVYYFFIDNWVDVPTLCLMERAVKHAVVIAEIDAPLAMIKNCVEEQGSSSLFEKSYAINEEIKTWLIENVLDDKGYDKIKALEVVVEDEFMGPVLPAFNESIKPKVSLPTLSKSIINDDQIEGVVKSSNFFDAYLNKEGRFENNLTSFDQDVVVDQKTGLMWQRGGLDIASIRTIQRGVEQVNKDNLAGFNDWRLPTMEEALSLLEPGRNIKGLYLHPCFVKEIAFVFVDAQRKPGGYWFVDFKQGRSFWSSGTIPGGFGRLVRSV
ncbi:MAG: DUF1566 domain-containing protein [Desulfotalea sp.]